MTDLETLRTAINALARRKGALNPEGRGRLAMLSSNLKTYEKMRAGVLDTNDLRVFDFMRKLLLADIAAIEGELRDAKEE